MTNKTKKIDKTFMKALDKVCSMASDRGFVFYWIGHDNEDQVKICTNLVEEQHAHFLDTAANAARAIAKGEVQPIEETEHD